MSHKQMVLHAQSLRYILEGFQDNFKICFKFVWWSAKTADLTKERWGKYNLISDFAFAES